MNDALVERLARQIAATFSGRDPRDPAIRAAVVDAAARVRAVTDGLASAPPPFPGAPSSPALSEHEEHEIIARALARLAAP